MDNKLLPIVTLSLGTLFASTGITEAAKRRAKLRLPEQQDTDSGLQMVGPPSPFAAKLPEPAQIKTIKPMPVIPRPPSATTAQPISSFAANKQATIAPLMIEKQERNMSYEPVPAMPSSEQTTATQSSEPTPISAVTFETALGPLVPSEAPAPGRRPPSTTPPPTVINSLVVKPVISPL